MTQFRLHIHSGSRGRLWLATAAALVLVAWGCMAIKTLLITKELMRVTPNEAAANPELMRFASKEGAALFQDHCATCHGAGGKGDRAMGVPDLADKDWLYGTGHASDIERVVYYGIRSHDPRGWNLSVMPAFARPVPSVTERIPSMTPESIQAVIAYLRKLEGKPANVVLATAGDKIYHGSGGCYDCHTEDAKGDSAIGAPDLTDSIWLYGDGSPAAIFDSIAYGRQGACPAWVGKLRPSQIREVSLFVYSLSHVQKRMVPA